MRAFRSIRPWHAALVAVVLAGASLRAGDDGAAPRPETVPVSTQMDGYLQTRGITHSVDARRGDFKGDGPETVLVKIYDVPQEARQNTLCATLAATAKRGRAREVTVEFFTIQPEAASQAVSFQPSRLPSGNGEVQFPRGARPVDYHLTRTVRL